MMKKQANINIDRTHFTSPNNYFVMESIIAGNTRAEAYVDRLEAPQLTIVWDKEHSLYCGGNPDKETRDEAIRFIKEELLTEPVKVKSRIIKVSCENEDWKNSLWDGLQELAPKLYPRSIYRYEMEELLGFEPADSTVSIKRISSDILNNDLGNQEDLQGEILQMWGAIEPFLQKGYGMCAQKDNELVGWCTGEYFSEQWCGIGIETIEEYQRQGIAAAMVAEFIKLCKEANKMPHWDCWKNNTPSVKTAEKLGFKKLADYEILFLSFI